MAFSRPRILYNKLIDINEYLAKETKHRKLFFEFRIKPLMDELGIDYKKALSLYNQHQNRNQIWMKIKQEIRNS